ncbi:glycosidase [Endozoicomonas sp. NE43]
MIKGVKPDCYILGEVWHDASAWLMGDQYDSVMNYPMTQAILDYFALNSRGKQEFIWDVNRSYTSYPHHVNEAMFNLLDSHDTSRILHLCSGNKDKAKLAYLFMFTQVGTPCIYYGGEVALSGGRGMGSEANRRCMLWDKELQDIDFRAFIKQLIELRKSEPDLNCPTIQWLEVDNDQCIAYQRGLLQFVINNSDKSQDILVNGKKLSLLPYGYNISKE